MSKQKRPKQRAQNASTWTVADVQGILHNPAYAGVGPFPAIVPEDQWIAVQAVQIEHEGEVATLRHIRQALLTTFDQVPVWMATPE